MKYISTAFAAIFLGLTVCNAQTSEKTKMNAVSFELGKTGLIYNLTFDHKPSRKHFGIRVGAGSNFGKYLNAISIGGGGYYLIGRENHFFELGVDLQYLVVDEVSDDQKGFAFVYPDYSVKTFYPSVNLGYRVYGRRTLFRIGFSPGLIESNVVPGGFLSFGLRF